MYFDPLTAWLVALLADGAVIAGNHTSSSKMNQYYKEGAKRTNDMMNGSILSIRDNGYASAESALNDIKFQIEWAQKSYEISNRYEELKISRESYEFILKLCEESKVYCEKQYDLYFRLYKKRINNGEYSNDLTDLRQTMDKFQYKAKEYQSILVEAQKGREKAIQKEQERAKKLADSDSNSVIILKSLLVIGLCIVGFSIAAAGGGLFGAIALIGAAIGAYFILRQK